jgi:3',5'-cyclic-AMP phosphodiesterase
MKVRRRPLRITEVATDLVAELPYINAAPGGRGRTEDSQLPIARASLAGPLADELDALIVCSDLQGVVPGSAGAQLLGLELAAVLEDLAYKGALPPPPRTGVILAGDLYSVPGADQRGGYGDVADVWAAFADRFAWVAGVAGNHDDIAGVPGLGDTVHLLDGDVVALDGLRIGGVGGIIGESRRPGRRREIDQLRAIREILDGGVDILVLHEGPHGGDRQPGNAAIRDAIEAAGVGLTICGHSHWHAPLAEHARGQILNVDARAMVLLAPR